jgi:proline iminopeptidase
LSGRPSSAAANGRARFPPAPADAIGEERRIDVPGGRVWARLVRTRGEGTPLVALHGGPGFPSYYLTPLEALADDRPVILYDQLGCGRSDRPDDDSLWTIERFARELDQVLAAFGFDRYHLYGHSWGSMLATRFTTHVNPKRVASIVMSSPALQVDWWERDCAALAAELEEPHAAAIRAAALSGERTGAAYEAATEAFYRRHVCKHAMDSEPFQRTVAEAGLAMYHRIQGPNEFTVTGDMKGWDFRPELSTLRCPVLFLVGAEDEARPNTVAAFATQTPDSQMVVIPDAAHLTMLDAPAASNAAVRRFLREVDARAG